MEEATGTPPVVRNVVEEYHRWWAMKPRRRYGMADQREVEQAVYRLTPAGTQEVAELIGISRQAAGHRLHALDHHENIWSKKVGPTMVWMHPRVMPDPDPERDTSADDVIPRVFGDVYRISRGQPPFGDEPRRGRKHHRRVIR